MKLLKHFFTAFCFVGVFGVILYKIKTGSITDVEKGEIPIHNLPASLTWSEYHELRREKYHFPISLRESFLKRYKSSNLVLIDPTTIPHDEWQRFIDIAYQDLSSNGAENLSKEATVIDFTEDFVYVLFLMFKRETPRFELDFRYWAKIDRKTGKIILIEYSN